MDSQCDVIIVGAGNAALCAAIAAREQGASVLVLEKAPEYFRGGNTYFTGGIIRCAYNGIEPKGKGRDERFHRQFIL